MKTKEEILKQMEEEMPFEMIGKGQMPYILEAMEIYAQQQVKKNVALSGVMQSLPDWYKSLSLLELQMKELQEDIPKNLIEIRNYVTDLKTFDMKLTAMRNRLHRAFEELKGNVA